MEKQIMQKFLESVKENRDYSELKAFKEMLEKLPQARAEAVKAHYEADLEKIKPFTRVSEVLLDEGDKNWCFVEFTEAEHENIKIGVRIWMPATWKKSDFQVDYRLVKEKFGDNWENWEETKEKFKFWGEALGMQWVDEHKKCKKIIPIKNLQEANKKLFAAVDKILKINMAYAPSWMILCMK